MIGGRSRMVRNAALGLALAAVFVLLTASVAAAQTPPAGTILTFGGNFGSPQSLYGINPTTGKRTLLSDQGNASEGPTIAPYDLAAGAGGVVVAVGLSPTNADLGLVVRFDPSTGKRTLISEFTKSPSTGYVPFGVAVEPNGNLLVTDRGSGGGGNGAALWEITTAGVKTKISDFNNPSQGPTGTSPEGVALDDSGNIYVADAEAGSQCNLPDATDYCGALFLVNPANGQRTLVSDFGDSNEGPLGNDPSGLAFDPKDGTFLVIDGFADRPCSCADLFRVNPDTGHRTLLSDFGNSSQGPTGGARSFWVVLAQDGTILSDGCPGGGNGALCQIDPMTGNRTNFSDFSDSSLGPTVVGPRGGLAFMPVLAPPPTVTRVSPSVGVPGKSESVDIFGANFQAGATPNFGPNITVGTTTFVNSGHLTATITVGVSAHSGTRNVSVANPGGGVGTCKLCFLVSEPSLPGRIVFQSNRTGKYQLYTMHPDGTNIVRFTHDSANDVGAAWSPSGARIAFVSDRTGHPQLYVINANGTGLRKITTGVGQWGQPTWSPDGLMLADENNRSGHFQLYTMHVNGTGLTRITNDNSHEYGAVSWSPDGTRLVFDTNRPGNYDIYTIRPDGTGLKRLTTSPGRDGDPEWSPDGTKIVFDSTRTGNTDVYSMNAGGSAQTRLTQNPAVDNDPTWGPEGKWIAFESDRSGNAEIFTMKANGSAQTERTYTANAVNDGVSWTG